MFRSRLFNRVNATINDNLVVFQKTQIPGGFGQNQIHVVVAHGAGSCDAVDTRECNSSFITILPTGRIGSVAGVEIKAGGFGRIRTIKLRKILRCRSNNSGTSY